MYETTYHRPASLKEAESLLAGSAEGKLLAGGQTLLPTMKQRLAAPTDLIDIADLGELSGTDVGNGKVTIGAAVTHAEVAASADVRGAIPALAELASHIGDPHVRHMGTLGGSVANNDPAADYPAALVALKADVHTSKRTIPADDFFTGLFETALEDSEIVTKVTFAEPEKAAYMKFPNPASRYAMAGVFVARHGDGVRVAVTGAGQSGVFRWTEAEAALNGDFSVSAVEGLAIDAGNMMSDIHGSAEYRANLVAVMTRRAVAAAG